ncbi:MAG: tetratricopeptide repeat protein [Turneriella sp.]
MKHRIPGLLFSILPLLVFLPVRAAEMPVQYYYDQAKNLEKSGDTIRAADMVREALRRNGDHVPSLLLLARLSLQNRDFRVAQDLAQRSIRLEERNEAAYLLCAQATYEMREQQVMNMCLDKAESIRRNNPDAQSLRAQLLIDTAQYGIARRKIQGILRDNPGHMDTQLRLAALYLKLRQFEKAEAQFRQVQSLLPENTDLAVAIARARLDAWFESNRLNPLSANEEAAARALEALRHAHSNNPDNLAVNLMLAQLLSVTGRCSDAQEYLRKLTASLSESRSVVTFVALCDPVAASKLLSDYLRRNEDDDLTRHQAELANVAAKARRENAAMTRAARYHRAIAKREFDRNADEFALGSLRWAEFLFPGYIEVHKDLLRHFKAKKDYERMADELVFLRDATQDKAYREMYEQFDGEQRELWYVKSGYRQPERAKNLLPVHIYPLRARDPLSDHPLGGVAIADRTRVALQDIGKVRSISREMAALPQAQVYSSENLRKLRQTYDDALKQEENPHAFRRRPLAFALMGDFRELAHGLEVNAELIDAETGIRTAQVSFKAEGRDYLNKAAVRLAQFVHKSTPVSANVLKIEDDDLILINTGRRDGLVKDAKFLVTDKLGRNLEFQVVKREYDITEAKSATADATRHLKAGDVVRVIPKT